MAQDFSIVTVSYNSENTIERTIKSVLNQSHKNFEYIIIDGGSTDRTNSIIKKYEQLFEGNLTHLTEPDEGIYDAMNKGISLAKGKVIGLLNSDDYYFENTLSIVFEAYVNSNLASVITGELIFKNGDKEQLLKTSEKRFLKKMEQYKNGVRHPATFVPKAIYDRIGLFNLDYKIASDAELMFRIYKSNYGFNFLNRPLLVMSDGGISNSKGITEQILLEKELLLNTYCPSMAKRLFFLTETAFRFKVKELAATIISLYRKIENT
ncbi:glycosyltransferase family 2 protein [Pareuzebyella sediminis]|uniref:glycosyltransferase family 2 protein n=1 Tax=Pareuzebyella sediminis TaxID=2607998 RepID=UPI0011EE7419|nr:glycosyltransferase family 2 protein [Pareuzebyella sediminis]